jgi:hypothetical protein
MAVEDLVGVVLRVLGLHLDAGAQRDLEVLDALLEVAARRRVRGLP